MTITAATAIIVRRRQERRSFPFGQLNTHRVTHPHEAFIVQEGLCKPSAVLGARVDADMGPWRGAIQEGDNTCALVTLTQSKACYRAGGESVWEQGEIA